MGVVLVLDTTRYYHFYLVIRGEVPYCFEERYRIVLRKLVRFVINNSITDL